MHGQGYVYLLLIGGLAALIGLVCFAITTFLAAKNKSGGQSSGRLLVFIGGAFVLVWVISPALRWVATALVDKLLGQ